MAQVDFRYALHTIAEEPEENYEPTHVPALDQGRPLAASRPPPGLEDLLPLSALGVPGPLLRAPPGLGGGTAKENAIDACTQTDAEGDGETAKEAVIDACIPTDAAEGDGETAKENAIDASTQTDTESDGETAKEAAFDARILTDAAGGDGETAEEAANDETAKEAECSAANSQSRLHGRMLDMVYDAATAMLCEARMVHKDELAERLLTMVEDCVDEWVLYGIFVERGDYIEACAPI